jgi:predicted transcriptional regulator
MVLREIAAQLGLSLRTRVECLDRPVTGAYCSDLLSDVMANAQEGNLWITLQVHQNIVAVAVLLNLAGIIISRGAVPDADTLAKAEAENIPIFTTDQPTFPVAGKLYQLLGTQNNAE